jgi:hypothetical protein
LGGQVLSRAPREFRFPVFQGNDIRNHACVPAVSIREGMNFRDQIIVMRLPRQSCGKGRFTAALTHLRNAVSEHVVASAQRPNLHSCITSLPVGVICQIHATLSCFGDNRFTAGGRAVSHSSVSSAEEAAPMPGWFVDITSSRGFELKYLASHTSRKYLPETMGTGVALFDYDNDGRLDIFLVNGAPLADPTAKGTLPEKSGPKYWNRLFHQKTDGLFEDVTEKAGLQGSGYGMGVAVGAPPVRRGSI